MAFFDEDEVELVTPTAPPVQPKKSSFFEEGAEVITPPTQKFFEEDVQVITPSTPSDTTTPIASTAQGEEGTLTESKAIPFARIQEIAKKYNVDAEELAQVAPYYNAQVSGIDVDAGGWKQLAGLASEGIGMGLPTFIHKKLQADESKRKALDEVKEEAQRAKSTLMSGLEIATSLGGAVGLGKAAAKVAGRALGAGTVAADRAITAYEIGGAGVGSAAQGLATSDEGEELKDATINGFFGLGLGGTVVGASKLLKNRAARKAAAKELGLAEEIKTGNKQVDNLIDDADEVFSGESGLNIEKQVEQEFAKNAPQEAARKSAVLDNAIPGSVIPEERVAQKLADDSSDILVSEMRREGVPLSSPTDVANYLSKQEIGDETKRFASWLDSRKLNKGTAYTEDSAKELISGFKSREGAEFLNKEWNNFRKADIAQKVLGRTADDRLANTASKNFFERMGNYFLDGRQFASRYIGQKLGINLTPTLDKLATANNKFTVTLNAFGKRGDELAKQAKQVGLDDKTLYNFLDTGVAPRMTPEQLNVANAYKKSFDSALDRANELGLPIAKRNHYIKHSVVDLPELIVALKNRNAQITQRHGVDALKGMEEDTFKSLLKQPDFKEFVDGVGYYQRVKIDNAMDFKKALRDSISPSRGREKWATAAKAAYERTAEEVPAFIRETDVRKLYNSWMHNTFRHAYMRDGIADVVKYRQMAADAGDEPATKWLSHWVADMAGEGTEGTFKRAMKDLSTNARVSLLEFLNKPGIPEYQRTAAKLLYEAPQMMPAILNQIYPNLLGTNIKAIITNLMQPVAVTWPELGGRYGATRVASAYGDLVNTIRKGKTIVIKNPDVAAELGVRVGDTVTTRNLSTVLMNEGQIPQQWNTELVGSLRNGIAESGLYSKSAKILNKATKLAMYGYEKSEAVNRFIARDMSNKISDDILRALGGQEDALTKGALKFLNNLDSTYRNSILNVAKTGDEAALKETVMEYLIGKSIFNYNRASLSEFGRAWGPLFSTFTKWPLSIAGDIATELTTKGAKKGGTILAGRYLAPFALLGLVDSLAEFESDRAKAIVGSGTQRYAALQSLGSVVSTDIVNTPGITAIKGLAEGAMAGEDERGDALWKWLNDTTQVFAPGAGFVRFTLMDLPALIGNEKPEGKILDVVGENLQ